jgi:hypothetical protein
MDIDDFVKEFMKQKQWHEAQKGEKCCTQCNSFKPWLRKEVLSDIPSILERYEKGEIGGCVEAGKLAVKCLNDARYDPIVSQSNGHCLLYRKMGVISSVNRAVFTLLKRLTKLPKTAELV